MNKPILLDYATSRIGEDEKTFFYDYDNDMNMYIRDAKKPFIDTDISSGIIQTETRIKRESDDEDYCCLELATKTEVARERDDEDSYSLAELVSKTFVERERDDEDDFDLDK